MKRYLTAYFLITGLMGTLSAQIPADGVFFNIGSCYKRYQYAKEGTISLPDYHDFHLPLNDTTILVISVLDVKDNLFDAPASMPANNIYGCDKRTVTSEIVDAVNHAEKMAYVVEKTSSGQKLSKVYELALWSRSDKYFTYTDAVHTVFHDFQKTTPDNSTVGLNAQVPVQFNAEIEISCLKGLQYIETTSFEIGKGNLTLTFLPDVGLYSRHNDEGAQQLVYVGDAPVGPFIDVLCDNQKTVFAPIQNLPSSPIEPANTVVTVPGKTSPLVPESVVSEDPDFQTVKEGDQLKSIAMENGVTSANLMEWNGIADPNEKLKPGRKLRISPPATPISAQIEPVAPIVEIKKKVEPTIPAAVITTPKVDEDMPRDKPAPPSIVTPALPETKGYKADENGQYTTVAGDNVFKVAKEFGISADDLVAWNNLGDKPIMVGRKLKVTPPVNVGPKTQAVAPVTPKAANADEYVLKQGETIYDVTQKFGVSIGDLINWNNLSSTMLAPGAKLKVAAPKETAKPLTPVVTEPAKPVVKPTPSVTPTPAPKPVVTPAPAEPALSWKLHTVKPKENLFSIATNYQTTAKQLREWNALKVDALSEGQVLKVGKTAAAEKPTVTPAKPTPTPAPASPAKPLIPANGIYTAVAGDSVHAVAVKFGLEDNDIINWNLLNDYALAPGQKIKLRANAVINNTPPALAPTPTNNAKTHTVVAGETLLQVATKYKTTMATLRTLNNLKSDALKAGDKLKVQ